MKSEFSEKEEPNNIVEEVEEEPVAQAPVVALDNLNGTLPWEENSQKVEEFKQKTVTNFPDRKIGEMFQNGETVREWKYATYENSTYFLCTYVTIDNQRYSTVFVQNVDNSINIAELYVDDIKQEESVVVAYGDYMFAPPPYYIIPDSDTRQLTEAEVEALDESLLRYARNEIFARHGRIFQDQELADYFNSQSWYEGTVAEVSLSAVETANVELIQRIETGEDELIAEIKRCIVDKYLYVQGTEITVEFSSSGSFISYNYYGTAPPPGVDANYYTTYSMFSEGDSVFIRIDGVAYWVKRCQETSVWLEGDGQWGNWYYTDPY